MHRLAAACFGLLFVISGCATKPVERDDAERVMFGPTRMRLHPIFTQVKDWTGDNRPDGIDAEIEFQDQFGDPTKAAGKVMFELYGYRQAHPDPRGDRIVNPWVGELLTLQQQHEHWNVTSRTYGFQLALPSISVHRDYVLTATFEHSDGRRFFAQTMLKAVVEEPKNPTTLPSTRPSTTQPSTLPPLPEPGAPR